MSWFVSSVIWPNARYVASEDQLNKLNTRIAAMNVRDDLSDVTQNILNKVEQKSGTLLTHVSLMVALTGALWALDSANEQTLKLLSAGYFGAHLFSYLLIALFCIRCQLHIDQNYFEKMPKQDFSGSPRELRARDERNGAKKELEVGYRSEVLLREKLFRTALISLYVITIEFAIAVLIEVVV